MGEEARHEKSLFIYRRRMQRKSRSRGMGRDFGIWGTSKGAFRREENTTNNRMELTAVIEGLRQLKYPCSVTLVSDSKYVIDAITLGWAKRWQKNNWMRNKKEKALNPDLWEVLLSEIEKHQMTYQWVKGHAGHPENERCDELAVMESQKFK